MFDSVSVYVLGSVDYFHATDTWEVCIYGKVLAKMGSFTSEIPVFIH